MITLLQWNIQDGGGGKQRKKLSLPLLTALTDRYKPDVIVLNESAAKIQQCPKATKRYNISGYILHTPVLIRNHYLAVMTPDARSVGVTINSDRIFVTLEDVKIVALHHDCHKGVDKPARDIQFAMCDHKSGWIAIGDWNYGLDKIKREKGVNDPAEAKFSVVKVSRSEGTLTFSTGLSATNRQTHRSGWIDGALTCGLDETERIHFHSDDLRTLSGQIASDHTPTLIRLEQRRPTP